MSWFNTRQENKEEQVKNEQNEKLVNSGISSGTTQSITEKPPIGNSVGSGQTSNVGYNSQSNGKSLSNKNLSGLANINTTKSAEGHTEKSEFDKLNNTEIKNDEITLGDLSKNGNKAYRDNDDIGKTDRDNYKEEYKNKNIEDEAALMEMFEKEEDISNQNFYKEEYKNKNIKDEAALMEMFEKEEDISNIPSL